MAGDARGVVEDGPQPVAAVAPATTTVEPAATTDVPATTVAEPVKPVTAPVQPVVNPVQPDADVTTSRSDNGNKPVAEAPRKRFSILAWLRDFFGRLLR